jgi:hypothetical protein
VVVHGRQFGLRLVTALLRLLGGLLRRVYARTSAGKLLALLRELILARADLVLETRQRLPRAFDGSVGVAETTEIGTQLLARLLELGNAALQCLAFLLLRLQLSPEVDRDEDGQHGDCRQTPYAGVFK